MTERSDLARIALTVIEGVSYGDAYAEALITSAFDNPDLAARSFAYLSGFILEVLGSERFSGSTDLAISEVRRLLEQME